MGITRNILPLTVGIRLFDAEVVLVRSR